MKSIPAILGNSNLTPKERGLLLIQDALTEQMYGTKSLSEADIESLNNFKSKDKYDNYKLQEYNEIMRIWKVIDNITLDSQTAFMSMDIEFLRSHRLFTMLYYANKKEAERIIKNSISGHTQAGQLLILKNSGLDYKRTIYNIAYSNLDVRIQQDSLLLFPDTKTGHDYFLNELFLAKYISESKMYINSQERKEIIDQILDSFSWDYINKMKVIGVDGLQNRFFDGYFAGIPHIEIIKRCAKYSNLHFKDENDLKSICNDMIRRDLEYSLKLIISSGISKWLDDGLFTQEFVPLCLSESKETCNGHNTTKIHKEILNEWQIKYSDAENLINSLIESGKLNIAVRYKKIFNFSFEETIITGESIFESEDNYTFIKEFREQVNNLAPAAVAISLVKDSHYLDWYSELLEIEKLMTGISKIIEIDITPLTKKHLNSASDEIEVVNRQINHILEKYQSCSDKNYDFLISYFTEDMKVKLYNNNVKRLGIAKTYFDRFSDDVSSDSYKILSDTMEQK